MEIKTQFGIARRTQTDELRSNSRILFNFRKLTFTDDENAARTDTKGWKCLSNGKVKLTPPGVGKETV